MPEHRPEGHDEVAHVYDDIREADNPLPRWWLATFFGTIAFSVGYYAYFQTFHAGPTQQDELAAEVAREHERKVAQGKAQPGVDPELLVGMSHDAKAVEDGAATFASLCAACHGDKGEGKIGPNLTDRYWLHGGRAESVYKTISTGIPDKGMPAWETSLGPRKTQAVTAFVLSIKGKDVAGKPPQGDEEKEN